MGRTITPTYRVEYSDNALVFGKLKPDSHVLRKGRMTPIQSICWSGKPSQPKLEDWRTRTNASYRTGGCNAHVAEAIGMEPHIFWARLVHQKTNRVVCETTMPAFEV